MEKLREQLAYLRHKIYDREENRAAYMSDMNNWLCVHTTRFEPEISKDGTRAILTTAMVSNYELPRATVHITLNQVVRSNSGGNWDNASIVILAPYKDVVSLNGQPQEVATEDTYFIANPDTGLVLPESTYIVRGSSKCAKLFEIGKNDATYKTDHFTDEEIEEILSLDDYARYNYEQLLNPDISNSKETFYLGYDSKVAEAYKNSKDKQAFLKGLLEEDRYAILNRILRNAVVKMAMEKMGYHHIFSHEDDVSKKVAEVALKNGLCGNSGDKGHSCSLEAELESTGCLLAGLSVILKSKNADQIYDALVDSNTPMGNEMIMSILNDAPLRDVSEIYEKTFNSYIDGQIALISCENDASSSVKQQKIKRLDVMKQRGIKGYNPHLDEVFKRQAKKINESYADFLQKLKENPNEYVQLKKRLSEFEISRAQTCQKNIRI